MLVQKMIKRVHEIKISPQLLKADAYLIGVENSVVIQCHD